ncbi:RNA-guided endonuclease IscB [uncultured Parasutterella sp.]|uniref:RNA-guided endonuclease IscB n=1 Tax=uncultured Parasutterella sp. TaxID=1263098 RepID=UPI002631D8A4|nr:RNA-guided endonuclease IscB [uncultured Parasutterella sp.]
MRVFVLNKLGKPLMPCSPAKARLLLKEKKAIVKRRTPFTIQLTIATGETKQPVSLGVDAGYKHVGLSASTEKAELYASEVELRQDITDLLSARRALRQSRRNRKTRYRAPRFDNRISTKRKGWLAPSVENRIDAHLSRIEAVLRLLPVTRITVETASFDLQLLKNPDISGKEYQEGEQLGFWNVREYVLFRDGHVCQYCHGRSKDPVLNVHHLESRRTGGDSPGNLITLCETCHKALHRGEIKLRAKRGQSFRAETFMGIMRWEVLNRLKASHSKLEVNNTYGYLTKHARIKSGITKSHCSDAFCIAGNLGAKRLGEFLFQKQTRRNNRQIHKLSILKGGIRKRNQAPFEINGFRLFDKVACKGEEGFIFGRRSSGSFDVRKLDGTRISAGISYKKLRLLEKRQTYLTEIRKEEALPSLREGRGLRA